MTGYAACREMAATVLMKVIMSLNVCKTCGSSVVITWTYIPELDGWLGKSVCESYCGHTSVHLAGNAQFQHNAKRFIAAVTSPFGF